MDRILYISYNDALGHLGMSQVIPYLKGLMEYGYEFDLLTYERQNIKIDDKDYMKKIGISWEPLKYHKYPSLPATIFDILHGIFKSILTIKKDKLEIIHARSYISALIGLIAKKFTKAKLIFDMRGFMADEYADAGSWDKKSLKYKLVKYFEKKLLDGSDYIITLTHAAKDILQKDFHIKKNISVIPCCVDLEKFILEKHENDTEGLKKQLKLENKTVMVYSGSLGGWYMMKEMIEFFIEAKKQKEGLYFLILTNSSREMVENTIKEYGISQEDYTILNIKPDDMPLYLSVADFSIAFIKPCFSKKGSSPIKFGEYLAMGLPILTNSGIGDSDSMITGEVGAVVKKFESEEYNRAFKTICLLLQKEQETSNLCKEKVMKYLTLEMGVEKYKEVYGYLNEEN